MNVIAEIQRINAAELENGSVHTPASWHAKYSESAWCYAGNLPVQLSEGDVICIMSQFGEVEDIHLVRDDDTGKSKGFCFVKYEDARSCVLAVDNFCGSKILERSIRVDHVEKYRLPKHLLEKEEHENVPCNTDPGHAYNGQELANNYDINQGQDLFAPIKPPSDHATKHNYNQDNTFKEERKDAKQKRKEERETKRHEKEERRTRKEEKRRGQRTASYRGRDSDRHREKKRRRGSRSPSE